MDEFKIGEIDVDCCPHCGGRPKMAIFSVAELNQFRIKFYCKKCGKNATAAMSKDVAKQIGAPWLRTLKDMAAKEWNRGQEWAK